MTLNKSRQQIIDQRRRRVAHHRLRGLSMDAICTALANDGIVNEETGKPYSKPTIKSDLDSLSETWRKEAVQDITEHRARQLAELQEIKQSAWQDKDPELALRALGQEMKLLGTLAPREVKIDMNIELVQRVVVAIESAGLNPADVFETLLQELHANSADVS